MIFIPLDDFSSLGRAELSCVSGVWDFLNDEDVTELTGTAIAAGTFAKVAALPNGVFRASGAATTANSGYQLQLESTPIRLDRDQSTCAIEARFRLNDIKEQVVLGFAITTATLLAGVTDGILLKKAAGAAGAWTLTVNRTGGASQTFNVATPFTNLTYHHVAVIVEDGGLGGPKGNGKIKLVIDGRVFFETEAIVGSLPWDSNLTPSLGIYSGDNVGTQTADVDYIRFKGARSFT